MKPFRLRELSVEAMHNMIGIAMRPSTGLSMRISTWRKYGNTAAVRIWGNIVRSALTGI